MHGGKMSVAHGARSHDRVCGVATHRECARELTLRCAAEVTDVWIPYRFAVLSKPQTFWSNWFPPYEEKIENRDQKYL